MINTNTSRWQSVRLLFDKHIIGVNLNSNHQLQKSRKTSCCSKKPLLEASRALFHVTEELNVTLKRLSSTKVEAQFIKWLDYQCGGISSDKQHSECLELDAGESSQLPQNQLSIRQFPFICIHSISKWHQSLSNDGDCFNIQVPSCRIILLSPKV